MTKNELSSAEHLDMAPTHLSFLVPSEHACYADHFPGNPLVPGALLLKWVLAQIEHKFHCNIILLKSIKFLAPIKPGDYLKVIVNTNPINMQLTFDIFVADTLAVKGSIEYKSCLPQHRELE